MLALNRQDFPLRNWKFPKRSLSSWSNDSLPSMWSLCRIFSASTGETWWTIIVGKSSSRKQNAGSLHETRSSSTLSTCTSKENNVSVMAKHNSTLGIPQVPWRQNSLKKAEKCNFFTFRAKYSLPGFCSVFVVYFVWTVPYISNSCLYSLPKTGAVF